jgi:hypothetical protein
VNFGCYSEYPEDRDSDTDGYCGQARMSAAVYPALMTVGDSDTTRIAHGSFTRHGSADPNEIGGEIAALDSLMGRCAESKLK